jgi:50S ribosomal subunit-associated GTPase HflX
MYLMANLTLIYGLRLLPEGEIAEIQDATLMLKNGHEAHVTMHVIDGSRAQIEAQLKQSLDAFFDFYPEI